MQEECLEIADLHSASRSEALTALTQMTRIEKKSFPATEAFEFDMKLWKRPNTRVLYASILPTTAHAQAQAQAQSTKNNNKSAGNGERIVVAYLVYVRHRECVLLHKLCVMEQHRRKGIGERLLSYAIRERFVDKEPGCEYVQLWVDKGRLPARNLYQKCGFKEKEEISDYYSEGRTGIRMVLTV